MFNLEEALAYVEATLLTCFDCTETVMTVGMSNTLHQEWAAGLR